MKNLFILVLIIIAGDVFGQAGKTENVILITLDGMRWQEIFNGADSAFMRQQTFLKDGKLKEKFWRNDLSERRKALMPFFGTPWQAMDSYMEIVRWDAK